MKTKELVVYGLVVVVILTALAFCSDAKAQFRPCVWPNTCVSGH